MNGVPNDSRPVPLKGMWLDSPMVREELGDELTDQLILDIELLDGAGDTFSLEKYRAGELAPMFFGSALNNFGIEPLLEALIDIAPSPTGRNSEERWWLPTKRNSRPSSLRFKRTWIRSIGIGSPSFASVRDTSKGA